MPKLVIDDRQIEVAPGTKVIEAAEQLGIMIPRFCYHPALGSVGACRVCAVKFLQGPFKGVQMSCMIDAKDGMVVSTTDAEAVDFRRHVIEWLMLNHPHDCPVCDEGGHCLLQDMTVSGGHGLRRYAGNKRTYADQDLGPLIQHEMNRCIHCYRCARYYQEFAGYNDLGVMRLGNRTYFGRFSDGILESPFSGNLSDLCPTGVFTDKPSRYFGRRWDYQRSPSLCINCSLGCHTVANVRYREVRRQEARFSQAVNGYFICDRGRYGFFFNSDPSRPRRAKINADEIALDAALSTARKKLADLSRAAGTAAIAAVGASRSSLETLAMFKRLCRCSGWRDPVFFMDRPATSKVKTAIARLEPVLAVSLREVEAADFILVVGADPVNEAPMLALAMRQAHRNGAKVVVLDPRPVVLPFDCVHLPVALDDIGAYIGPFVSACVDEDTAQSLGQKATARYAALAETDLINPAVGGQISGMQTHLQKSRRPLVVCGTDIVPDRVPALAADCACFWRATGKKAGLFYLLPGANGFGAGILSDTAESMQAVIEAIESGAIKGLICAEADPLTQFADRRRLERALEALDVLIVLDYINTPSARKAHVFLPTATLWEGGGIFINQEGRVQSSQPVYQGGLPILQSGGGDHPPRIFGTGLPGAGQLPAWIILAQLANEKEGFDQKKIRENLWTWLGDTAVEFADFKWSEDIPDEGMRLTTAVNTDLRFPTEAFSRPKNQSTPANRLELIRTDWTFGTEELSSGAACLREVERPPCVTMHANVAGELGLQDGDRINIQSDTGSLDVNLKIAENMAAGVVVMPRHRNLAWQHLGTGRIWIDKDKIRKVPSGDGGSVRNE